MAIVFRGAGAKATDGTSPFQVIPALPAGMVADDIVILVAATEDTGTASINANGSIATWTAITGSPVSVSGGKKLYVWWGRWASGTTGPTINATTNMVIAATQAWSGCDTTSSVINTQETGNETTSDTSLSFATTVSTSVANCMVLLISTDDTDSNAAQHGSQANTNLGSVAEQNDVNTNAGTPGGGFQVVEGTLATAGAIGTWTATLGTASPKAYLTLALQPPQNVTTTKTTTGVARVQKSTTQTTTGKGDILKTTTRTTTGKAAIQKTTTQTITGSARLQKTVSQTTTGLGRIQKSVTQTQTGKGAIKNTTTQTTTGKANISTGSVTQTTIGRARIQTTTSATQTGKGDIRKTVIQTTTGKGDIQKNTTQTIAGLGRIQKTVTQTQSAKGNIRVTTTQTQTGKASLTNTTIKTQTGIANLVATTTKTQTGKARITARTTQTITGKANIDPLFSPLKTLSLKLTDILSQSLGTTGNLIPIDILTDTPDNPPPGNKGIVFKVVGGVVTIYVWDGTNWIAK